MSHSQSNGRAPASQRAARLDAAPGNPGASFGIGWPIGFKSRTSDPKDRCYVGKPIAGNPPTPGQRPRGAEGSNITYGVRIKRGSRAWDLWCLLVRRAKPMTAAQIAIHLVCEATDVNGAAHGLIKGHAVIARKVGRIMEYSVGPMPVAEV